jgi:hypothetical protein
MWTDWIDQWEASADCVSYEASARLTLELLETATRLNSRSLEALRQTVGVQSRLAQEQLGGDERPDIGARWADAIQQVLTCTTSLYKDAGDQWQVFCSHANQIVEEEQLHLGQGVGIPLAPVAAEGRDLFTTSINFWLDVAAKGIEQLPRFNLPDRRSSQPDRRRR